MIGNKTDLGWFFQLLSEVQNKLLMLKNILVVIIWY